ncbi:MAG: SRPBCC family protein [Cyanobacteria bacterium P01_F01_bin.86]
MPLTTSLAPSVFDLSQSHQAMLRQGDIVLTGQAGSYAVWALVQADMPIVWEILTAYEEFPKFLPSVVASRVLERRQNRVLVQRKDRRKVGWMPITVKIVTENIEIDRERIDYRMVDGTLDSMQGNWQLASVDTRADHPETLLVQNIEAKANLGPVQSYFYEVFEQGLTETLAELRTEMERRMRLTALPTSDFGV